jgi:hypothetical protein
MNAVPTMNAGRAFDGPTGDLLLTLQPLLRVLHGDKRARLQRAFINTVYDMAARALNVEHARLPPDPVKAAKALHRAVLELCARAGVPSIELVEGYNDHARTMPAQHAENVEEAIERCLALLSVFHARRIEAAP